MTTPGPYPLAGVAMPTWILRYDKRGTCSSPLTRAALLNDLRRGDYTDVIAFSHGWNNDFDDAVALYAEFLQRFEKTVTGHRPGRPFKPLFFGIIWPSTWLVFDKGPAIAGAGGTADDGAAIATGPVIDEMAGRLAESQADVECFYELMEKDWLSEKEAETLAKIAAPAFAGFTDDENDDGARGLDAKDLLSMMRDFERAQRPNAGAAPDIDEWGGAGGVEDGPQAAGILDKLDPRNAIRLFSVYQMKDRAGSVGYRGMAPLLRDVLQATAARVHAVGHSYGCKVMLSALCEPSPLARPVDSLLLLEPAVSHLCFATTVPGHNRSGGYRAALEPARVRPPILTTYSKKDFPLHDTFHLALRRSGDLGEIKIAAGDGSTSAGAPPSRYAALGGYGPRGAAKQKLVDPLPAASTEYPSLAGESLIGLDGSNGLISGHGDVRSDATAWALYQLAFRQT